MFDPERDTDGGPRRFYVRLGVIALISVATCGAMLPAATAFSVGDSGEHGCLAIADGWHADVPAPSAQVLAAARAATPALPTHSQALDAGFMEQWRAKWRAAQASPAVVDANTRQEWLNGSGACVPESRHRLIITGLGLGALVGVLAITAIARRLRARTRLATAMTCRALTPSA